MKKIREWKDIGTLRNELFAHNLRRGKNGQFIFSIENLQYNAPRTLNDIFLLVNLFSFAAQTANLEFKAEIAAYQPEEVRMSNAQKPLTKEEVSTITMQIIQQATQELRKLNKPYDFSFAVTSDWDKI